MILYIAILLLLSMCGIYMLAAHFKSRRIIASLKALRQRVEDLKSHDASSQLFATSDIAGLSVAIDGLRTHYEATTVSKAVAARVQSWHWEVLSGLLASLRSRLEADSPLLEGLSDYALLLQTERGDSAPQPRAFHIAHVLDASLKSARAAMPTESQVHLTTSLQSDMPKQWIGQPEMMEALLRHLLLIGLKRTRNGFVCLRLDMPSCDTPTHSHTLRIMLEDSGPLLQPWQLQQWLAPAREEAPNEGMSHDISWLLTVRLFKRLNGVVTGACGAHGGMTLEGHVPVYFPEAKAIPAFAASPVRAHFKPPLILVVEQDKVSRGVTERLFSESGCQVFMVADHAQALEWAPLLPFSAIVLNAMQPDMGEAVTRRLRNMAEDRIMPDIALWVSLARLSFIEFDYWRQHGVVELLLKPLQPDMLRRLCVSLKPHDPAFYQTYDERVRLDLPPASMASLPEMNKMLGGQLALVEQIVRHMAQGEAPPEGARQSHAVKSAALTMGYFRLAALMGYLERAFVTKTVTLSSQHWKMIAEVLEFSGFE